MNLDKKVRVQRWLRFLLGGGINTAFTYAMYIALNQVISYQVAYLIAYATGVIFAYWFNAVIVFKARMSWKGCFSYPIIYITQYAFSALVLGVLIEFANVNVIVAPLIVTVVMIPVSYILNRYILTVSSSLDSYKVEKKKRVALSQFLNDIKINGCFFRLCPKFNNSSLKVNNCMHNKLQRIIIWILISLPVLNLANSAISWLRYGIDLPYWDDWRIYVSGEMGSFDLGYLFESGNDTLYPIGKVLDSLAYRYLDGNTVAYQFISMVSVLGLLLLLQWRLLLLALNDKLLAASAFSFTLLMLQPDSYWGAQNLAYHQAIPLVASLASIYIVLRGHWVSLLGVPILLGLGLISGFSYISGAFAVLALGVVFLFVQRFILPTERKSIYEGGLALLLVGIVTTLAQVWVIVGIQKGSHLGVPMAWPNESNFWFYMLGKVARSLMLPIDKPVLSLIVTCCFLILVLTLIFWSLRKLIKQKPITFKDAKPTLIFFSIFSMILIYLGLVSAGRVNSYSTVTSTSISFFTSGYERFHYFWITLLWPWVAAILFISLRALNLSKIKNVNNKIVILPVVLISLISYAGVFNHSVFFKNRILLQADGVKCLIRELQNGSDIQCPGLYPASLETAFLNAKRTGASFTRIFQMKDIPIGTDNPPPLFRMPKDWKSAVFNNATYIIKPEAIEIKAGNDPMILFKTNESKKMAECNTLDIVASISVSQTDWGQIFYRVPGQEVFMAGLSSKIKIKSDTKFEEVVFTLESNTGFIDDLRFDPVMSNPQQIELKGLEVRCRIKNQVKKGSE